MLLLYSCCFCLFICFLSIFIYFFLTLHHFISFVCTAIFHSLFLSLTHTLDFSSLIKVTMLISCNVFKCIRYLTRCKAAFQREKNIYIQRDIIILNGVNDFQQKRILILRFDSRQYAREPFLLYLYSCISLYKYMNNIHCFPWCTILR